MRPPWIEASALLAAHGHTQPPGPKPQAPTPRHTPLFFGAHMPPNVRYALWRKVGALEKPTAYQDLPALCRAIHRDRRDRPIHLADAELPLAADGGMLQGVSIWLTTDDGQASPSDADYLGFAVLAGCGREALQAALRAAEPPRLPDFQFEGEAA